MTKRLVPKPPRVQVKRMENGLPDPFAYQAWLKLLLGRAYKKMQSKYSPHQGAREVARRLRAA